MKFEVSIPHASEAAKPRKLAVEASNWFEALTKAVVELQERIRIKNFLLSILDDGHSAQMIDPQTARAFDIKRVSSSVAADLPATAALSNLPSSPPTSVSPNPPTSVSPNPPASASPNPPASASPNPPASSNPPASPPTFALPSPPASASPNPPTSSPPRSSAKEATPHHSLAPTSTELPPPKPAPAASLPDVTRTPSRSLPPTASVAPPPAPASKPLPSGGILPPPSNSTPSSHSLAPKPSPSFPPASPSSEILPAAPRSSPLLASRRPGTGPNPSFPEPNPHETFTASGQYSPGKTNDFLTDAFMKLAALYDHFGNDRRSAILYVLDLVSKGVACHGAAILLIDINDPSKEFWFGGIKGPDSERLESLHIASKRGVVGFCAEHGVSLNLPDLRNDPRAKDDAFLDLQIDIGPSLFVPIQHQRRLQGILLAYRKTSQKPFVQGEMNILEYFATSLADYLIRD